MNNKVIPNTILSEALQWHLRVSEPDASAEIWTGLADWLAQDKLHNDAYDYVSHADADLNEWAELQTADVELVPANVDDAVFSTHNDNDDQTRQRWYTYGGLGLAASIILSIILWPQLSAPRYETIITKPGQTQIVQMGEGSRIHVNGDSEVTITKGNNRFAKLERGEAKFYVKHDARNPFTVLSGKFELVDQGTIFNVKRTPREFSVGVSEGAVTFRSDQKLVEISRGKMLSIGRTGGAVLKPIDPSYIGEWTRKQLTYDIAPIATVIADINRNTGLVVAIDPSITGRTFSGTIQLNDDPEKLMTQLEQLLDLDAQDTKQGWLLTQ
ncbi:MAG: FecR domain-containing protein [Parasphingorhabdus sp.]|uniref:FecR family protein n=1 Tax=Parasphingorhabdus sp. TaxID=2709688 RepID=UPI003002005D